MKDGILIFLLGVFVTISIAATSVGRILTTKPAKPIISLVKSFTMESDSEDIAKYIRLKIRGGYQLKEIAAANNGQYRSTWIVVMERYQ